MKVVEFTYTDAKGKVSTRTLLASTEPSRAYEGIDVSEMPADDFRAFLQKYAELREDYINKLTTLQAEFDLTHNYRRFLEERMTEIKVS